MKRVQLPNGLTIWANTPFECTVLYRQLFLLADATEQQHGIVVRDGDCVFDVGANIGMYSLRLARGRSGLRIHAFEPIPSTFRILARNAEEHLAGHTVVLRERGLWTEQGEATFQVDPTFSAMATLRPTDLKHVARADTTSYDWVLAGVNEMEKFGRLSTNRAAAARSALAQPSRRWLVMFVASLLYLASATRSRVARKRVRCALSTISLELRQSGVERVDLLKIDVEGAELEVLRGIDAEDWPKIRQLSVEVRDIDNRLATVVAMLRERGYTVSVAEQDSEVEVLMGVSTVYATRG